VEYFSSESISDGVKSIIMPKQTTFRVILRDRLKEKHFWFQQPDRHVTCLLMIIRQETDYVVHHIQKVAAFFAAMRSFAERILRR
jgi:deoxyribodipyrimidine photolyase-related protein